MSTVNIKQNQKDNSEKKYTCYQFYTFTCLVVEFCHFFTTRMLECQNCLPSIACNNEDIVLKQTQWLRFYQAAVNNL